MRPVGGLVIGYIGDRWGRKQALVLSLFLMGECFRTRVRPS